MRTLCLCLCFAVFSCSPNPDQLPPDVTEPEQPFCDPDQNPQEHIKIHYFWDSGSGLSQPAFIEACEYFAHLGIACVEVQSYLDAGLVVESDYGYYYCYQNAQITESGSKFRRHHIIINRTCMPQNQEAYDWQREVFAKKIGELLGVGSYPGFCGAGNFANYVDRWWFRAPYDGPLTAPDELAWYHRDRSSSAFGETTPAPYCGPDTDAVPPVCATPTDADDSFIVRIYATPDIWDEALFACNMWAIFGIICLPSDAEFADIAVFKNSADACAISGKTDFNLARYQWIVNISGCLNGTDAAMRVSHQIGHVFGLPHIPKWCAAGIMNNVPGAECLTWADYGLWHERMPDMYSTYE